LQLQTWKPNGGGKAPGAADLEFGRNCTPRCGGREIAKMVTRKLVGHALVDHGGVCVVDPEYTTITDEDNEAICEAGPEGVGLECGEEGLAETDHVGVYVPTGLGDGCFPIYADTIEVPGAGTRVARIVIDCLGVEDESDELRDRLIGATGQLRERTRWPVRLPYDRAADDDVRRRALGES
jgi:hypothetical protein